MKHWLRIGRAWTGSGHFTDRQLSRLVTDDVGELEQAHLDRCPSCVERLEAWRRLLRQVAETGREQADAAVQGSRLATQHQQIMRRLRRTVEPAGPARVLRFPTVARPALRAIIDLPRATRWLGAASIAGLLIGVTVGQFLHLHPSSEAAETAGPVLLSEAPGATTAPVVAASTAAPEPVGDTTVSDEALLDEVELVIVNSGVPELRHLDEITPRVREIALYPW